MDVLTLCKECTDWVLRDCLYCVLTGPSGARKQDTANA
jgi:hypothetical protein